MEAAAGLICRELMPHRDRTAACAAAPHPSLFGIGIVSVPGIDDITR
jgi:hypothetical protein